ncbi:hypothetical protein B0J13DRAFT_548786 [Dactylonectria estremocensis]|uniref:Uncharacterized protein n=1 Tax=Dactylonectria estremocensis TaxID=1079267 RepID=A0A9P9J9Y1_9HYPO|nr:hypothetical protein B0J13DRAFT_548786 [Dactylonectria estremocensis]
MVRARKNRFLLSRVAASLLLSPRTTSKFRSLASPPKPTLPRSKTTTQIARPLQPSTARSLRVPPKSGKKVSADPSLRA